VLKIIIDFVLDVQVNTFRFSTWILLHGIEKLSSAFRISMESLQHVLKCMLGHCLRIKLLSNSDADLLSYF